MVSVGSQLGPYKILAPLGAGGMGEVYRAEDSRLDREVAIKVLPEQFAQDPERLARFEREAKAVAALAHPNILVLHDFGTQQGVSFAVMELLEKGIYFAHTSLLSYHAFFDVSKEIKCCISLYSRLDKK